MNPNSHTFTAEPTEAEIQHAAYLLWLESGRAPGHDLDHWFAAKELLRHRHGRGVRFRGHPGAAVPAVTPSLPGNSSRN